MIAMDDAREAVMDKSSEVELPRLTLPFSVAVPAHVRAEMDRSFVPSVTPLRISLKFCMTWEASAVVPLVNVYVYEGLAMVISS